MMEPPDIEDPFDWSVDEVVAALCNTKASWTHSRAASPLPELKRFEQALRDNEINGCILLTQVDHNSLREDLGLKILGHRGTIMLAIHKLRGQSHKWNEHIQEVACQTPLPGSSIMMSPGFGSRSGFGSPFYGSPASTAPPAPSRTHGYNQSPVVSPQRAQEPERSVVLPLTAESYPEPDTGKIFSNIPELPRPDQRQPLENFTADAAHGPPPDSEVEHQLFSRAPLLAEKGHTLDIGVNEDPALHSGSATQQVVWESNHRPGETYVLDDTGRKRRRLALTPIEPDVNSHLDDEDDHGSYVRSGQKMEPGVAASHTIPANIAETLIKEEGVTSLAEKNSLMDVDSIPEPWVERDTGMMTAPAADDSGLATELPEAGKLVVDNNGQKRMRPMLVSQPDDQVTTKLSSTPEATSFSPRRIGETIEKSKEEHQNSKSRDSGKKSRLAYLGPKSIPVDEVFYGSSAIGEEVKIDVQYEISVDSDYSSRSETYLVRSDGQPTSGQRLYVHELMKHFLCRSERKDFSRNGQSFTAVIPYPRRIERKHQSQSFTLYSHSPSAIIATREDLSKWPAARNLTDVKGKRQTDLDSAITRFNVPNDDPFSLRESANENHDWDFLEKWRYVDQVDKVLPVYGDSGSEGEYDLDTWREMEEEQGTLERPMGKSRTKRLTKEEVLTAIGTGVEELGAKWRRKSLPRKEHKAWRIWTISRRDRSKHQQIELATARIDYLNNTRLSKMRKEMMNEVWSNVIQVKKQCKIMEETVFELEDQKWLVSVLQLTSPPPKPPPRDTVQPSKAPSTHDSLGDDEEILESENDLGESSDDDLDGFIIEDDVHEDLAKAEMLSDTGRVLDADDEHVLDVDHSDNDSEDQITTPTARRRFGRGGVTPDLPLPALNGTYYSSHDSDPAYASTHDAPLAYPNSSSVLSSAKSMPNPFTRGPFLQSKPRSLKVQIPQDDIIDLTLPSDPPEPPTPGYEFDPFMNVRTPPLNPLDDNPFRDSKKSRVEFRVPPMPSTVINLESESSSTTKEENGNREELPGFSEVEKISQLNASYLVERQDRKRLLIRYIHKLLPLDRQGIIARTIAVTLKESQDEVWSGLAAIKSHAHKIRGADPKTSNDIMRIAQFYVCWSQNTKLSQHGFPRRCVERTLEDVAGFECFYTFLCESLARYENELAEEPIVINSTPEKPTYRLGKRKPQFEDDTSISRMHHDDSDDLLLSQYTPHKKRKNAVQESVEARDIRINDQQRVQDQERRRQQLMQLQRTVMNDGQTPPMIVNVSKFEHQDLVYVNPCIATKIKPHQLEGVQFMWRELVTDERSLQGCLLAHTMGLGKTMQVITLLVTVAECAKSRNSNIRDQIPTGLRESRTLILCPPSLLDNWWDEFLIWAPVPMEDNVGQLRKVASGSRPIDRLQEISAWHKDGGVLIISYDMFRLYVLNKATKSRGPPLSEEQHARVKTELLEGPNIIVADEAHKMKNIGSAITSAASQLRSKSRIALTGSPLANNLEEYYAMINWIAPGYLGDIVQFRARYVEPIQEGLYQNSSASEKRSCLKMLQVLKRDLDPKINRADITVLKGSLKPKTEFVIKVPLTKLQEDAYRLYVKSMLGDTGDDEPANTRLWDWLAILALLCNHPLCFKNKLVEREVAAQQTFEAAMTKAGQKLNPEAVVNSEDESMPGDAPVSKVGVSRSTIEEQLALFDTVPVALDSINHSYKMQIFNEILDASIAAGDKVLVFSHSIPTLNYLENLFMQTQRKYARLDGKTKMSDRQKLTKDFNSGRKQVCLISTRAGGLGLNLPGANRVVIFDFGFNPIWEEQAVGRAYRIGQEKPVFVYRFTAGGTFEDRLHNQSVFKMQLASRVVDKKNPTRFAMKGVRQYLFEPKPVEQKDVSEYYGKDPLVLDRILATDHCIRSIELTETFQREDDDKLTAEEEKEAEQILKDEQLKRSDPAAYHAMVNFRDRARMKEAWAMQAANAIHQPQYASGRFQSTTVPTMPMARPQTPATSRPPQNPQTPQASSIGGNADQGVNTLRASVLSNISRYPSLSPVAGANTKVKDRFQVSEFDAAQTQPLPPHALPFKRISSGTSTTLGDSSKGEKDSFMATPAEAAGPPHSTFDPVQAGSRQTLSDSLPTPPRTDELSRRPHDQNLLLEQQSFRKPREKSPWFTSREFANSQRPSLNPFEGLPSNVPSTPTLDPPSATPGKWVTEAEVVANLLPDGIKLSELAIKFRGRVRNSKEFINLITKHSKYDPSTQMLRPRKAAQAPLAPGG